MVVPCDDRIGIGVPVQVRHDTESKFRLSTPATTSAPATPAAGCDRPLRADARRNRERILAAARAAFAQYGADAQMDDIARRAEVGVGTVYRHFPTKDDLLTALAAEHFAALAALAREAMEGEPDPWEAFARFLRDAATRQAEDRSIVDILSAAPDDSKARAADAEGLWAATTELVARAQAAGSLRADVLPEDVPMLMCAVGQADRIGPPARDPVWPRMLALILDGLRAGTGDEPALPARAGREHPAD